MKTKDITLDTWRDSDEPKKEYFSNTDLYYARLANKLYRKLIVTLKGGDEALLEELDKLCIKLSRYLEDIISSLGIFQAFREFNQELTGSLLPFFNVRMGDDYYDDDLNIEDIKLLVWSYFQYVYNCGTDEEWEIVDPKDKLIADVAQAAMDILVDAFETAPENETLQKFLFPNKFERDIFLPVFERLEWFSNTCYMTSHYHWRDLVLSLMEKISSHMLSATGRKDFYDEESLKGMALQSFPFEITTLFLSLPNYQFYGRMLKNKGCDKSAQTITGIKVYDNTILYVEEGTPDGISCYDNDGNTYDFELKGTLSDQAFKDRDKWECVYFPWVTIDSKCYLYSDFSAVADPDAYPVDQPTNRARFFVDIAKEVSRKAPMGFVRDIDGLLDLLEPKLNEVIHELPLDSDTWRQFVQIHFDKDISPEEIKIRELSIIRYELMKTPRFNENLEDRRQGEIFYFVSSSGRVCIFRDGVCSINLPENYYYNARYKEVYPVEYFLLRRYNYELAKYLIEKGAYKVCKDNERHMKKVRHFVCDNIEFLSRYFYNHQFTCFCNKPLIGILKELQMDYPNSMIMLLTPRFTYEILDEKDDEYDDLREE